jgi:hypothetical protein
VAISDPATAHFTAHKNLGNTSIAYKPRHPHTHTHPETLEARGKKKTGGNRKAPVRELFSAEKCVTDATVRSDTLTPT